MKIDLHNYEAFLLDYFEGRLKESDVDALRQFAREHPELDIDLSDADFFTLPSMEESAVFEFKNSLKKNEAVSEDELAFEYIEGQLTLQNKQLFENRLQNDPVLAEALNAYKNTILTPDLTLQLDQKENWYQMAGDAALAFDYIENRLNASEKEVVEKRISSDKRFRAQTDAYKKTILAADLNLTHPDKSSLKHREARIVNLFSFRMVSGLAAGLVIIAGLYVLIQRITPDQSQNNLQAKTSHPKSDSVPSEQNAEKLARLPEENSRTKEKGKNKIKNSVIRQLNKTQTENSALAITSPEQYRAKDKQKVKIKTSIIRQLNKDTTDQYMMAGAKEKPKVKVKNSIIRQLQKDSVSADNTQLVQVDKTKAISSPGNIQNTTGYSTSIPSNKSREKTERLTLIPTETDSEEDAVADATTSKKRNLWSKALSAAGQLNNLGLKSVNGNSGENGDILSLSNVSVELKKSK